MLRLKCTGTDFSQQYKGPVGVCKGKLFTHAPAVPQAIPKYARAVTPKNRIAQFAAMLRKEGP